MGFPTAAGHGHDRDGSSAYLLRRSRRARRISVRVDADRGLVVTAPPRASAAEIERVLRELDGWIAPRMRDLQARRQRVAEDAGMGLPYLGQTLRLEPEAGRQRVHRIADRLVVPEEPEARSRALTAWYRGRARTEAEPRLAVAAQTLGAQVQRLRITDTRTRWGSCSTNGTISLSWRLLLAPEACLDYVVWHEACHLVHAHHRSSFWGLLQEHRPAWQEPAAWLKAHGTDLRLWLPAVA